MTTFQFVIITFYLTVNVVLLGIIAIYTIDTAKTLEWIRVGAACRHALDQQEKTK